MPRDLFATMPAQQAGQPAPAVAPSTGPRDLFATTPQGEQTPTWQSAAAGIGQGALLNWGDEIVAGLDTATSGWTHPGGFSGAWQEYSKAAKDKFAKARSDHPYVYGAGEMAGAMALPLGAAKGATTAARAVSAGKAGALAGALAGAGAGETPQSRLALALQGGAIGGTMSAAAPYVGQYMGRGYEKLTGKYQTPSAEDWKALGKAAYEQADNIGGIYVQRPAVDNILSQMDDAIRARGGDRLTTPGAVTARKAVDELLQGTPSIQDIELARQKFTNVQNRNLSDADAGLISNLLGIYDDATGRLTSSDITSQGDPQDALGIYRQAREYWTNYENSRLADNMARRIDIKSANLTQSGKQNAIKREAGGIGTPSLTSGYKAEYSRMTPAQQRLVDQMATPPGWEQNLRNYGEWVSPNAINAPYMAAGMLAGGVVNPLYALGTLGVAGTGMAAKSAAAGLQSRRANLLQSMLRSGGTLKPGEYAALQEALARGTIAGSRFTSGQE